MIKIFCDICKEEIKQNELASNFKYMEKTTLLVKGETQPEIRQFEQVFCEKCTDEIKEKRDELAKEQ